MKERGMIFKGDLVRAILEGRKTQTRRPITPQPELTTRSGFSWKDRLYGAGSNDGETNRNFAHVKCPHGKPGDRIWVRETFSIVPDHDEPAGCSAVLYAADGQGPYGKWRPSIHMPREYSRITLEITDVRVERLNSISEKDAQAEGMTDSMPILELSRLWNRIYPGNYWQSNPWVWVIEFKQITEDE